MWSQENTEALKNKIAELKNKSLKKQSMENSSETKMEFTHAQRWDLSVMKILELESSLKEQGLEMAGLEKKISDLSEDCCNQKRKNEDDYLAYQQTLKVGKSQKKKACIQFFQKQNKNVYLFILPYKMGQIKRAHDYTNY